jgi:hypothetical protein
VAGCGVTCLFETWLPDVLQLPAGGVCAASGGLSMMTFVHGEFAERRPCVHTCARAREQRCCCARPDGSLLQPAG